MGGTQSSRKLTVDNENSIQVSQDALDRIQAQLATNPVSQKPPPKEQYSAPPPPPFYDSQKRHQEFAAEEAYWAQRIEGLKRAHEQLNSNMRLEYQKTLKEANELFEMTKNDKVANKLPPCQDEKAKVLQCYDTNPNKSLLCSVLVNHFNDCVCNSRIAAITSTS